MTNEYYTEDKKDRELVAYLGKNLKKFNNYITILMKIPPDLKVSELLDHHISYIQRVY